MTGWPTSGIGKATALAFAEAGAKAVITGRREKEVAQLAAEITKTGGAAAFIRSDVAKEADVVKAMDFALSTHGRLDVGQQQRRVSRGVSRPRISRSSEAGSPVAVPVVSAGGRGGIGSSMGATFEL